jgi:hypothetical protein
LSTASDVGTYDSLYISSDVDAYLGQIGKAGFWWQLTASIIPTWNLVASDSVLHTYIMTHSLTGSTAAFNFHQDNPTTVTVSGTPTAVWSSGSATKWLSGAPTVNVNDVIAVSGILQNAVKEHYCITRIGSITEKNSMTGASGSIPPSGPYNRDAFVSVSARLSVLTNKYTETMIFTVGGYNSKNSLGTTVDKTTAIRVDTVSNEASRLFSGLWGATYPGIPSTYPAIDVGAGCGSGYNATLSSISLVTNAEECQLINGYYRYPESRNYTANLPTAGPNYTIGMGTLTRWVTLNLGTINYNGAIKLVFTGHNWTQTNAVIPNLYIYVKVNGGIKSTGWVNANKAWSSGNPVNDEDAALDLANTTTTASRYVNFGTTQPQGTVYVAIGFAPACAFYFSTCTMTLV